MRLGCPPPPHTHTHTPCPGTLNELAPLRASPRGPAQGGASRPAPPAVQAWRIAAVSGYPCGRRWGAHPVLIGGGCDRPPALQGRRRTPAATRARAQQAAPPGWGRGLFVLFGGARARRWCGPSSGPRAMYGLQQHGSTTVRVTPKEPREGAVAALVCSAPVHLHTRSSWCGRVRGTRRGCQRRTVRLPGGRYLPPASQMRALGCRCRLRARPVFAPAAAVGRGARRTNPPEPGPV